MYVPVVDFGKYNKIAEQSFFKMLGKVVRRAGRKAGRSVHDPSRRGGRADAHHGRGGRL